MRQDPLLMTATPAAAVCAQWTLAAGPGESGFVFAADDSPVMEGYGPSFAVSTGQPLLDGGWCLQMLIGDGIHRSQHGVDLLESDGMVIGQVQVKADSSSLEEAAYDAYSNILRAVGDRWLCRIWNYVPQINRVDPGRLENYRLFCSGRSRAFEDFYGPDDPDHIPAASGTGTGSGNLTVVFAATESRVESWENPEQLPAYNYPKKYGPRAPSFARASRFTDPKGVEWVFVSGTAAIKGSDTIHPGDFRRQLPVTLDNIDLILRRCGLRLADCPSGRRRHFKAFLRDRGHLNELRQAMRAIMRSPDTLTIVEADICRSELEVEIELTVFPA